MPSALDLTLAATAADELGVASSSSLESLITRASVAVASYLGYPLQRREALTESVASQGGPYLFLRAGAIQSVASRTSYG